VASFSVLKLSEGGGLKPANFLFFRSQGAPDNFLDPPRRFVLDFFYPQKGFSDPIFTDNSPHAAKISSRDHQNLPN